MVERVAREEAQWRDHAILIRTAPQARSFEGELRARSQIGPSRTRPAYFLL